MRTTNRNSDLAGVTLVHLELGLLLSAMLMDQYGSSIGNDPFGMILDCLPENKETVNNLEALSGELKRKIGSKNIFFCGYEAEIADAAINQFESIVIIPNGVDIALGRLKQNYEFCEKVTIVDPFSGANLVCPDSSVLVPIYPLRDGTLLSYNYSAKFLSLDTRRNSFQILGIIISQPLNIKYGYDRTGFSKVMSPVDPSFFSDFIYLNKT